MIVRDKLLEDPYKGEYDEEYLLTVSGKKFKQTLDLIMQ
jgi:hypothetical protein